MSNMPQRSPVDFIPFSRTYVDRETGAESGLITDLALLRGRVTLNHLYDGSTASIMLGNTIFNEITITTPVIPESIQNLIEFGSPLATDDASKIANAIASVIERRWDPEQFHLVMHSSGYDSRIISKTIANLRDKHGESWLGKVLFLCWEPEGPEFKAIMSFEGWRKEQYHICNEGAQPDEYCAGALDFDSCWKWTNDAQPPIWIAEPTIEQLRESGIITKPLTETQFIAGGAGHTIFQSLYPPERLTELFYYSRWGARSRVIPYSERIVPFLSYDVLRLINLHRRDNLEGIYHESIAKNRVYSDILRPFKPILRWVCRKRWKITDLLRLSQIDASKTRLEVVSYLSPGLLRLRKGVSEGPTTPHRQLSERLRKKCLQDFTNSWYYKNVTLPHFPNYDLDMPKNIWIDDWWGVYAKASICEYLVKNGVKIIHATG